MSPGVRINPLDVGGAVAFDPNGGDLNLTGHLYLAVDANGVAGYQPGQDFVVQVLANAALTIGNFI